MPVCVGSSQLQWPPPSRSGSGSKNSNRRIMGHTCMKETMDYANKNMQVHRANTTTRKQADTKSMGSAPSNNNKKNTQ